MRNFKILKTYIKYESEEAYKVIKLVAFSNGQFNIDIFNVFLDEYQSFGEGIYSLGWTCDDEPEHSVGFNDFFSADKHLELITSGLHESSNHNPAKAVNDMLRFEEEQNFKSEIEYRNRQLEAKQAEYDKANKFEATCSKTGERKVFAVDTEEKALNLAEMLFPDGVLRIEKIRVRVKPDEREF